MHSVLKEREEANKADAVPKEWHEKLYSILDILTQSWVRGLACLFLIGECLIMIIAGGQNQGVIKKLVPWFVGTLIFLCALQLAQKGSNSTFGFGSKDDVPNFGHYHDGASDSARMLDKPLTMGIDDFTAIMFSLESLAITLITIFCILNLVFSAFKLWAGTAELKKIYVDVIYKCILCIVLMNFYPLLQTNVVQFATAVGSNLGNAKARLETVFIESFMQLKSNISKAMPELIKIAVKEGTFHDKDGNAYIPDEVIKYVTSDFPWTKEDINKILKDKNITTVHKHTGLTGYTSDNGYYGMKDGKYQLIMEQRGLFKLNYRDVSTVWTAGMAMESSAELSVIRQAVNSMNALSVVLTGSSVKENALKKNGGDGNAVADLMNTSLDDLFYNPYLRDDKGNQTSLISPSALMKTTWLMADCVTLAAQYEQGSENGSPNVTGEDNSGDQYKDEGISFNKTTSKGVAGGWFWNGIFRLITSVIYSIGMSIATCIVIVEYTMCLWEYYIVTSLAILLIPLAFLDATKSYAQNIIKIFLQYAAKIMVLTLACFYSMGLFLDVCQQTFVAGSAPNLTTVGTFLMYLFLGVMFTVSSEKIANILFTGTPQMSMGDVVHAAHETAHAAQGVKSLAKTVGSPVGKLAQKGVNHGLNTGARIAGAVGAARDAKKELMDSAKENGALNKDTQKSINSAARSVGFKTFAAGMKQDFKDSAKKMLTGKDSEHRHADGSTSGALKLGQKFTGADGKEHTASLADVKNSMKSMAKGHDSRTEKHGDVHENGTKDVNSKFKAAQDAIQKNTPRMATTSDQSAGHQTHA